MTYILQCFHRNYTELLTLTVKISNYIKKFDNMEEQLDDNLSILYCGTTNDNIIASSGDVWDKTDDPEKDSSQ